MFASCRWPSSLTFKKRDSSGRVVSGSAASIVMLMKVGLEWITGKWAASFRGCVVNTLPLFFGGNLVVFHTLPLSKIYSPGKLGCGAAEATGLGFVCFVVMNPCVLSARVDLGFFLLQNFFKFIPPQSTSNIINCLFYLFGVSELVI